MTRNSPLIAGCCWLLCLLLAPVLPAQATTAPEARLTVIVVTIESLMPEEVVLAGDALPTLQALRSAGTWYTESRGVFPAQGLNGHAALLTGRYPEQSGIPGDRFWSRKPDARPRAPARPSDLQAPTLLRQVRRHCPGLRTAALIADATTSELYSGCGSQGDHCGPFTSEPDHRFAARNSPAFNRRLEQAPDTAVMDAARQLLPRTNLMFISLADLKAVGRLEAPAEDTGELPQRQLALAHADRLLGDLVADLRQAGRWDFTVLIVTSLHGLEWSEPRYALSPARDIEALHPGLFLPVHAGGVQSFYLRKPHDPAAWEATRDLVLRLRGETGIAGAWLTSLHSGAVGNLTSAELTELLLPRSLHARNRRLGDLVITAAPGYHFTDANGVGPGLHGYDGGTDARHNTLLISGGARFVRPQVVTVGPAQMEEDGRVSPHVSPADQSETVDIAPTIAWLLGLPAGTGSAATDPPAPDATGFDGRILNEAFLLQGPQPLGSCGVP